MRDDWEIKDFKDSYIKTKKTNKINKRDYLDEGKYPIVAQGDELISGYWNKPEDVFQVEKPIVIFGDHTRNVKYVDFDFVRGADGIKVLKTIEDIHPKFYYYYLKSLNIKNLGYARHFRLLKKKKVYYPSLDEQKRIVSILDDAFEAIDRAKANIERNIANAEELFQSKLDKIFKNNSEGWEPKKLGEIGELISGQHIKSDNYNNERRGIGYLTGPSDFGEIYPIITKWTGHPKRTARANDILITVKGSGVGKINLMDKDELAISRQLKALRVKEANTRFVYLFLSLQYDYLQDLANGAAIPGLSISDIMELEISIPDEKIQNQLVDEIISFESQIIDVVENYKKKLNSLKELKQSILLQAFSGELTKQQELVA